MLIVGAMPDNMVLTLRVIRGGVNVTVTDLATILTRLAQEKEGVAVKTRDKAAKRQALDDATAALDAAVGALALERAHLAADLAAAVLILQSNYGEESA